MMTMGRNGGGEYQGSEKKRRGGGRVGGSIEDFRSCCLKL